MICPRCGSADILARTVEERKATPKSDDHGFLWWLLIGWWWGFTVEIVKLVFITIPVEIAKLILHKESGEPQGPMKYTGQSCGYKWRTD